MIRYGVELERITNFFGQKKNVCRLIDLSIRRIYQVVCSMEHTMKPALASSCTVSIVFMLINFVLSN